ncbi:MAG TPA: alpha/beta fold hydrolase [Thermoanaerobaculia bacterium]|nr:alpha/beta fold hydrolase [Thermoanaerobaculia bacterium]
MLALAFSFLLAATPETPAVRWEPFELPGGGGALQAQLGKITVPLRRGHPESGTAELAFVRLRTEGTKKAAPIVYLAGGPGGSGVNVARNPYALPSLTRLAEIADVILLDQRGIGKSTPKVQCAPTPAEPQARFAPAAEMLPRVVAATRACVEEWTAKGIDVAGFTMVESAADVEDLRKALGVPKLSLMAHSYGTSLALAIVRAYPASIERAALIGTSGPNHMRKLPLMLDAQLAKLSILAKDDMTARLTRVLAKLEREPIPVRITDQKSKEKIEVRIGPDALRRILVADIGDGNDFPVFPALLRTIEQGDPSILAWFVEKRYNQASMSGVDLMYTGMRCSGGATASRDREIAQQTPVSIFANALNGSFPEVCAALPTAVEQPDAFKSPIISDLPILFISGTLDSNTPPYQAEEIRWTMPYAMHVIVANAGHEDLEPNADVQLLMADYFAGKDVSARRIALPVPAFRSVEEAKKERFVK